MNDLELILHHGPVRRRLKLAPPGESSIIGRSADAWETIDDPAIAYEHAVIRTSDVGASVENISSSGTTLNGRRLQQPESLAVGDEIHLSKTVWFLVAASEDKAKRSGFLPIVLIISLIVCAGAWFVLSGSMAPSRNDVAGFAELERWLDVQAAADRVPQTVAEAFREAWRLEKVGQFKEAERAWAKVGIAASVCSQVDSSGQPRSWAQLSGEQPKALDAFVAMKADLTSTNDAQHAAAVVQFAVDSANFAGRRALLAKNRR